MLKINRGDRVKVIDNIIAPDDSGVVTDVCAKTITVSWVVNGLVRIGIYNRLTNRIEKDF